MGISGEKRDPNWAKSLSELRGLADDELIRQHDEVATSGEEIGSCYYLQELARRDAEKQTRKMVTLTVIIAILTLVNVAAVILSVT